jgi:hypothetical protein
MLVTAASVVGKEKYSDLTEQVLTNVARITASGCLTRSDTNLQNLKGVYVMVEFNREPQRCNEYK